MFFWFWLDFLVCGFRHFFFFIPGFYIVCYIDWFPFYLWILFHFYLLGPQVAIGIKEVFGTSVLASFFSPEDFQWVVN